MDKEKNIKQYNNIPKPNLLKEASELRYHAPKMRVFPMKKAIQGGDGGVAESEGGVLES